MNEILQELIRSTAEKGPQKHFYSNLAITEPFQKHVEISSRICKGISYLEKSLSTKTGFQSRPFTTRKCEDSIPTDSQISPEIYTSLLALELFGDGENFEIQFSDESLKCLRDFILPECAITTLNIFKISSPDSGGICYEPEVPCESDDLQNIISDDCNTTSLVVSNLLHQGILDYKPAGSVAELMLSNAPNLEQSDANPHGDKFPRVVRTFLGGNQSSESELDSVTCTNVLYLYYQTDMNLNYEENVETTEIFLVHVLNNLLAQDEDSSFENIGFSTGTGIMENANALHHSPDALIFFLSRVTTISPHVRDRFSNLLTSLLDKRISTTCHVLDLSMRILSADALGLLTNDNSTTRRKIIKDFERLELLQNNSDGSWPADSLFKIRINGTDVFYGGVEMSTIFACKALDVYYKSIKAVKIKTRLYKDFMY